MQSHDYSKSYFKIKDVAEIIGVPQSTLRFWEKEFAEIQPKRSSHNQRYYTPDDLNTLKIVKYLIKDKGLKIEAAKEYLRGNKKNLSRKVEIIEKLTAAKEELEGLLKALNLRGEAIDIPPFN